MTLIDSGATNLSIVLLDNGVYEVTGGQKTAAARTGVDFAGVARAIGYPNVGCFRRLDDWQRGAGEFLGRSGPRFVWLVVESVRRTSRSKLRGRCRSRCDGWGKRWAYGVEPVSS